MMAFVYFSLSPTNFSGLGYIVGSAVDKRAKDWHWALRVSLLAHRVSYANFQFRSEATFTLVITPPCICFSVCQVTPALGLLAVFLLVFVVQEPKRGAIEARPEHTLHRTSWLTDMKALIRK